MNCYSKIYYVFKMKIWNRIDLFESCIEPNVYFVNNNWIKSNCYVNVNYLMNLSNNNK